MPPLLSEIVKFLDATLPATQFRDTSLNGLQIEAAPRHSKRVDRVAVAVDAALETARQAIAEQSQLLIVHHGLFWDKPSAISGRLGEIVRELCANQTSLYASHLPLDAHPSIGNNALLCALLELNETTPCFPYLGGTIGWAGTNASNLTLDEIRARLASLPGACSEMLTLRFGPGVPKRVGIVSGSGADALHACADLGIDTLITGEPRQFAYHFAREAQLNAIFAGHYATETVGVRAAGELIAKEFGIPFVFVNCPTGI